MRLGGDHVGMDPNAFPTHGMLGDWLSTYVKDALQAWFLRSSSCICSAAKLSFAKLNAVDLNGHYIDPTTNVYYWPTPVGGGNGATMFPQQCSWAISLTTGLQRGPAHRGRFYSPMPNPPLNTADGLTSSALALGAAQSAAALVIAVADTPGLDALYPWKVLVMSKVGNSGATHPVTGVEVGRVIDTQQRRRNQLHEDYQSAPADQGDD
jgi:hypothetical protein